MNANALRRPCSVGCKPCDMVWGARSNADVEAQIAHLRAELLHKEQENERVQAALAREVEERERAERQVGPLPGL